MTFLCCNFSLLSIFFTLIVSRSLLLPHKPSFSLLIPSYYLSNLSYSSYPDHSQSSLHPFFVSHYRSLPFECIKPDLLLFILSSCKCDTHPTVTGFTLSHFLLTIVVFSPSYPYLPYLIHPLPSPSFPSLSYILFPSYISSPYPHPPYLTSSCPSSLPLSFALFPIPPRPISSLLTPLITQSTPSPPPIPNDPSSISVPHGPESLINP